MQAFHNDPAVKEKYQSRLSNHRKAEQLVQGRTGEDDGDGWKGCAVACTLDSYDHSRYPVELGLPEWLARLEDHLFERLPKVEAEQFAEDFLAVIPVGANVEPVRHRLAILRQEAALERLKDNKEPYADQCRNAINLVIVWHRSQIEGPEDETSRSAAARSARSAWSAAESAARSAARSAESAWSAAESAEWAAWSAAESAEWAAESAARSAARSARSAEWSAARSARSAEWSARSAESNYYKWEAATLLKLLSESV